jgi:membrane-associated phospholipid phosphatase
MAKESTRFESGDWAPDLQGGRSGFDAVIAAAATVLRTHRGPFAFLLLLIVVDYGLCVATQLTFGQLIDVVTVVSLLLVVGMLWQTAATLAACGNHSTSRLVVTLSRVAEGIGAFGIWLGFAAGAAVLSYACARMGQPLYDSLFSAIDRSLGFDWLRWDQFVTSRVWLNHLLKMAYFTMAAQLVLIFFLSAFSSDRGRGAEFVKLAMISVVITCVISGLLPALGAKPFHGVAGADWVADLLRLRSAGPLHFDLSDLHGIGQLPSFHTALAVIYMWSWRGTGPLGWGVVMLNALMIVSTLTTGGHYLIDVIAGAVLALGAIYVVSIRGRQGQTIPTTA